MGSALFFHDFLLIIGGIILYKALEIIKLIHMVVSKKDTKVKNIGFDVKEFDTKIRPQDDFFHYINAKWIKKNPIPASESYWGSFLVLRDNTKKQLFTIVDELSKDKELVDGSASQMVRDLYLSGMDEKTREDLGFSPLQDMLDDIDKVENTQDIISLVVKMHTVGLAPLWSVFVDQDERNPKKNIVYLHQDGISMPDRDYYVKKDAESERVRAGYEKYIVKMFQLYGETRKVALECLTVVMDIETALAKVSLTGVERRDIAKQYNKVSTNGLKKNYGAVDWNNYFESVGLKDVKHVVVMHLDFFGEVNALLQSVSLDDWKIYLRWKLMVGTSKLLDRKTEKAHFDFYGKVLGGVKREEESWKRVLSVVNAELGEALGKVYVEKFFPKETKRKLNEMVDNLFEAYAEQIKGLEWMSGLTKKKALKKLSCMDRKLGYPKKWKSYKGLKINTVSYVLNVLQAERYEFKRMVGKLHKPVDKTEWHMTPQTVNAYYSPLGNEIVFPAGIIQPPLFHSDFDDAINYGAMGVVIGHEMTHGFDDQGSQFDAVGNYKEWWTKDDRKAFQKKTSVLVKQFNEYEVLGDLKANGELTLGENIADFGGVKMAYKAYQKLLDKKGGEDIDGLTPEQRFFIGFALFEREHSREEHIKRVTLTDVHSIPELRINGTLSNVPEFYDAYGVKKGDKLYRTQKSQANIW